MNAIAPNNLSMAIVIAPFTIKDIPAAMRVMGWRVAPLLMEHWFSREPWTMSEEIKKHQDPIPLKHTNNTIVKMEWAKNFGHVKKAVQELSSNWLTNKSKPGLVNYIKENYREKKESQPEYIDGHHSLDRFEVNMDHPAQIEAEKSYVNTVAIKVNPIASAIKNEINDFYGALGDCQVRVVVCGNATCSKDNIIFVPRKLGFYIEDNFEFNGNQLLGFWNQFGVSVVPSWYHTSINNSDFQKYRSPHSMGGDFRIYSDIFYQDVSLADAKKNTIVIPIDK